MATVTAKVFIHDPDEYLAATANGDVIVTQKGEPWIVLRTVEDDADRHFASFVALTKFHQIIERRRQESAIAWQDAKQQLGLD